jgi:hypothetical protein
MSYCSKNIKLITHLFHNIKTMLNVGTRCVQIKSFFFLGPQHYDKFIEDQNLMVMLDNQCLDNVTCRKFMSQFDLFMRFHLVKKMHVF